MGQLIEGVWSGRHSPPNKDGRFVRAETRFRNWVTADGSPGPTGAGRLQGRAGPLPSLRLACLPLGAAAP